MRRVAVWLALTMGAAIAQPAIVGHGGPVRAIAADGQHVVSGGFDGTAIVWPEGAVLRSHDGAVNAVALMTDGRVVTGGADGHVIVSRDGRVMRDLCCHSGPVAALAVQGELIASAAWDGTARVWDGSDVAVFQGHDGNVNAVAFAPDGTLITAGYDGTVRTWRDPVRVLRLGVPQNAMVTAPDGEIATAGADGMLRLFAGDAMREVMIDTVPLTALAISPDGAQLAVASLAGTMMVLERVSGRISTVLHGTERPIWALAFAKGEIVSGGAAGVVSRWDAGSGRKLGWTGAAPVMPDVPAADRGAQIFRACQACHTMTADGGNRAGPSLYGLIGRKVGTWPGYRYSEALIQGDMVWTPETIDRLFEIGPAAMLPGTKMPEQRLTDPADRSALVQYLAHIAP